ncbi:MAG: Wzz/FepE/Etk N-terminal domain-containing protein [Cytophagales bacterium]|nr:Wzz/FepE/Etk N-terminal domain-containing protein [Cytophagales bacterium]
MNKIVEEPKEMDARHLIEEDEIDLVEVMKNIWKNRKTIVQTTVGCLILGLFIAFTTPKEFEVEVTMLPESQDGGLKLGGLGGLASLAGVNLGGMGTAEGGSIPPELYPKVLESIPLQVKLLETPVYYSEVGDKVDGFTYFEEYAPMSAIGHLFGYTVGLPGKVLNATRKDDVEDGTENKDGLIRLSREQINVIKGFKNRLSASVDQKSGVISLTAKMPEAEASAIMAQMALDYLTDYVKAYKTQKAKQNLEFIQGRYDDQKANFEKAQNALAEYRDRNQNIVTSLARTEGERLQNEYDIAFEVYKGLATQLEQAKIKLKEETPVFKIIEPVRVPIDKASPKKGLILIVSVFLGGILGVGIIFIKNVLKNIKEQW